MKKVHRDTIARSVTKYVNSPEIAFEYDGHYAYTPLLDFDNHFLKEVLPPEGALLDIGCGTGRHLIELTLHGLRCVGLDLSPHMVELARAKLEEARLEVPVLRANMTAPLPFAAGAFDAAICMFSTMGLVPGRQGRRGFLEEVSRVLKPGGVFVLHVHNRLHNLFSAWGRCWLLRTYVWDRLFTDLEIGDRIMKTYRGIENMYLHVFSLREIKALLAQAGFAPRRIAFLNDRRSGEITGRRFASLRANGFLIAAAKR
ncbi:MAG: class I SAM-dependent methyltransferase [Planctomycetota bacterium]|jgi:SAM-dependent methyltransferase